jgi:hypothetical protein
MLLMIAKVELATRRIPTFSVKEEAVRATVLVKVLNASLPIGSIKLLHMQMNHDAGESGTMTIRDNQYCK